MSPSFAGGGLFFDYWPWLKVGGLMLLLSALFWVPFVRRITHSLSAMTRAAEAISQGRFQAPLPTRRQDELGRLARAIQRMAQRLDGLLSGQKRFLGDIAHELCSPIARIQVALGILEQRADENGREYVADLQEEVAFMSQLVNELLSFSKATLQAQSIDLKSVSVAEIVEQALRRERAETGAFELRVDPALRVAADPDLISRAVSNLLRNARRYAAEAGPIEITATATEQTVTLSILDRGPGVPETELPRLTDPFYRPELSRSRETGGSGLGLAIVKTCVESCRGTFSLRNRDPSGLQADLTFLRKVPPESTHNAPTHTSR